MSKEESKEFELPRVASELIKIAVEDARQSLKQGFSINMSSWGTDRGSTQEPNKPENCSVCFAGSVMLQRDPSNDSLRNFDPQNGNNYDQYVFLDLIRDGYLADAMRNLGHSGKKRNRLINETFVDSIRDFKTFKSFSQPEQFFEQMLKIANDLKEIGY